jgi:dTDP-4-dehydrorhamnose 3,5-epimerase
MVFTETSLPGVYLIDIEPIGDSRGFFARGWCRREFEAHNLDPAISQINNSFSPHAGTLRGIHYQRARSAEAKTVRCVRGAIFDVAVDMRESSPNYLRWIGHELSADNRKSMYIPKGFAHGYQTLLPDTELLYSTSEFYSAEAEVGIRYDDPSVAIRWPEPVVVISDKDASWPDLNVNPRPDPGESR